MCSMEKGTLASCEITYFPIQSENYLEEIRSVIKIIEAYEVEVEVGVLSTTIRGNSEIIFQMMKKIYDGMSMEGCNFTMSMMVSNICGCKTQ